mmetsp:Transcript_29833/g.63524  ORF Transcript_29833/g.63524 Transcript_29833/m.63524 type:complete len:229 (-) Transcript_29833:286-972(-)
MFMWQRVTTWDIRISRPGSSFTSISITFIPRNAPAAPSPPLRWPPWPWPPSNAVASPPTPSPSPAPAEDDRGETWKMSKSRSRIFSMRQSVRRSVTFSPSAFVTWKTSTNQPPSEEICALRTARPSSVSRSTTSTRVPGRLAESTMTTVALSSRVLSILTLGGCTRSSRVAYSTIPFSSSSEASCCTEDRRLPLPRRLAGDRPAPTALWLEYAALLALPFGLPCPPAP